MEVGKFILLLSTKDTNSSKGTPTQGKTWKQKCVREGLNPTNIYFKFKFCTILNGNTKLINEPNVEDLR